MWNLTKLGLIATIVAGLVGFVQVVENNTWDGELSAQEVRINERQDDTNARMLTELLRQTRLLTRTLEVKFQVLQVTLRENELARYRDMLQQVPKDQQDWILSYIDFLEDDLSKQRAQLLKLIDAPLEESEGGQLK